MKLEGKNLKTHQTNEKPPPAYRTYLIVGLVILFFLALSALLYFFGPRLFHPGPISAIPAPLLEIQSRNTQRVLNDPSIDSQSRRVLSRSF